MKKILSVIIVSLLTFTSTLAAYIPTFSDINSIEKIKPIIQTFDDNRISEINWKISDILPTLDVNSKDYWAVTELRKVLDDVLNSRSNSNIQIEKTTTNNTNTIYYDLVNVVDGDTINIKNWREFLKIRMIWIDAPESTTLRYWHTEPYGDEATQKLKELIWNNKISIEYDESQGRTDKYWRTLAYIFVNWINVNEEMIRSGYAKEYTYNTPYKYQQEFKKAQIEAMSNIRGLWNLNTGNTEIKNKTKTEIKTETKIRTENNKWNGQIKWNINSKWEKIYHLPYCPSYSRTKIDFSKWERFFNTEEEARKAWWRKARNC